VNALPERKRESYKQFRAKAIQEDA